MSDHRAPRTGRLRKIGRASAVVTGGVLAISGFAAGTASADEGYGASDETTTDTTAESSGFIPTSPVDGVANHWMMYHYQEENFAFNEYGRVVSDPQRYIDIHLEMVQEMLGQSPEGSSAGGMGGY